MVVVSEEALVGTRVSCEGYSVDDVRSRQVYCIAIKVAYTPLTGYI